jgi:hypothetical protein
MKKYFLNVVFLCLCAGFVFVGCDKDDDDPETSTVAGNKITATVSAQGVAKVKALIYDYDGGGIGTAIAECDYSNGGFTLALPETVDAKNLGTINDMFPSEISVSDKNAKLGSLETIGYSADGAEAGTFWYESKTCDAYYIYTDRNVTIKGSFTDEYDDDKYVCNVSFVKGWNIVYEIESKKDDVYTYTSTSSNPGGLSWVFYSRYEYEPYQAKSAAKSVGSKKRLFKGLK